MTSSLSLREVVAPTLIRQDDYAHPSGFDVINPDSLRPTDIVIPGADGEPYELEEGQPLTSRVFVAPLGAGNALVPIIQDDPDAQTRQTAVVVPGTNLTNCQDLTYQIQFFSRTGSWPRVSTVAVLNLEDVPVS